MRSSLHWIDYTIVAITVLLTIGFGAWFARRQNSSDKYYTASGKRIPSWVLGMSIFATLISSVTYMAYPAAAFKGNWILLVQGLMVPIVLVCVIWVVVPLFRRVIRLSAYEYFERRFGFFARIYSSVAFSFMHFTKMGTVLFLLSTALHAVGGFDITATIIVLGLSIIALAFFGGIEAVIWMDLLQGLLLILGGVICLVILLWAPEGGPMFVISKGIELGKISVGPFDWDFAKTTFWVMAINGVFYALQKYGTDQTIVQRYLTAKDDRSAKKAAYIGALLSVPVWTLFMFIGSALFIFYTFQVNGAVLPEGTKADEVFPFFMRTQLPVGVVGLVLAGLISAAVSSLDADMNSLSAVALQDYYLRFRPDCPDKEKLRFGRLIVLLSGLGCIGIALLYAWWGGEGVLGKLFELYAIFSAGIVGVFLLGLLSRRANKQGLYVGMAVCIIFTAYAVLTTTSLTGKNVILDLGKWNFPHSKYMLGVYSHIIVFVVGYFASFLFKNKTPAAENLTIYGHLKDLRGEKA